MPFSLWQGPPSLLNIRDSGGEVFQPGEPLTSCTKDRRRGENLPPNGVTLFLFPDGLKRVQWIFSIMISGFLWYSGERMHAFITLFILLVLAPNILFFWFRVPVLVGAWRWWPSYLTSWFQGIPLNKNDKVLNFYRKAFVYLLHPFSNPVCPTKWRPSGSYEESYLRAATTDFFRDVPDSRFPAWRGRGFRRFAFYYCFPLWTSAVSILYLGWNEIICGPEAKLLGATWWVFSFIFMYRSLRTIHNLLEFRREDEKRLHYPEMHLYLKQGCYFQDVIGKKQATILMQVPSIILALLYQTLVS